MGNPVVKLDDPRVQRTRQQLVQAVIALAAAQDFRTLTVQQITSKAGVNRATFYAHFPHKDALVVVAMQTVVQQQLVQQVGTSAPYTISTLRRLIIAVAELLRQALAQCRGPRYETIGQIEAAVQQEIQRFLLHWLANGLSDATSARARQLAAPLSWLIFGACRDWNTPADASAENIASQVLPLVLNGLNGVAPLAAEEAS